MRRTRFDWLLLIAPLALGANACADGDTKHRSSSGGGSGGAIASGDNAAAGSKTTGAANTQAGEPGDETAGEGGISSGAGRATELGGEAGAAGAAETATCAAPTSLTILGDYREANGDELWLRDSGKAVTWTRVPSGKPASGKPPALWQVALACTGKPLLLLLKNSAGRFARLDYVKGAQSLTACLSVASASTLEGALQLPPADRANTIDAGCNGGPWTRLTKGQE